MVVCWPGAPEWLLDNLARYQGLSRPKADVAEATRLTLSGLSTKWLHRLDLLGMGLTNLDRKRREVQCEEEKLSASDMQQ